MDPRAMVPHAPERAMRARSKHLPAHAPGLLHLTATSHRVAGNLDNKHNGYSRVKRRAVVRDIKYINMFINIILIGSFILTGAAAGAEPIVGPSSERVNDPGPASCAGADLPTQEGVVSAVAFAQEAQPRLGGSRQPQAGGDKPGKSAMWSFVPERDRFRADAILDLRGLNEPIAGQSGFIGLSGDKNGFVRGDGVPVRFWGVNYSLGRNQDQKELGHSARFLAKRGVNIIRFGAGNLNSDAKNPELTDANPKYIEQVWQVVAAMKKEGIYTTISPYWSSYLKQVPRSWGIEGWPENQVPAGLLFFNAQLQTGYKAWLKALLAPRNPYTGVSLGQDPALAMILIQNEESLLFWTEQSIKGKQLELLGKQFAEWAKLKYGTLEAALRQWNGGGMPEDAPAQGVLGIHIVWQFTQTRSGGVKKRLDDQLQFFAETMHRFNKEIMRYLREDLGCKQLIIPGNWRTADSVRLYDAERWSYTAGEVLAVNHYYSLPHLGPDRGWRINNGDQFQNVSVLFNPSAFPIAVKQVAGYPMLVTETNWVSPLGYLSEAPFLTAAYQSLTGVDIAFWASTGEVEWSDRDRGAWDSASRHKWAIATPMVLGQFPAAALLFRRGDVSPGQPAVLEHRTLEQLWERVPPIIAEESGFDPNRDQGDTAKQSQVQIAGGVQPLAFLVGPVEVVYGSDPAKTAVVDLNRYVDREKKLVRSVTGELVWDYGRGLCTINAPRSQGASGLLKSIGPIKLRDVTIDSENSYATVLVVSLDDEPLARTSRALVQVGTRARPTGWRDHAVTFSVDGKPEKINGRQIDDTGRMPWVIDGTKVTIGVRNANLASATLLDINGSATRRLSVRRVEESIEVELPTEAMYVVLSTK
jgi:hypothetical protein